MFDEGGGAVASSAGQVVHYIEQMLVEMAEMASTVGETALAASLALTALQAAAARGRVRAQP